MLERAQEYTRQTLAETRDLTRTDVLRLERQATLYISTLRRYIEAMGGELEIVARFPDGVVRITHLESAA